MPNIRLPLRAMAQENAEEVHLYDLNAEGGRWDREVFKALVNSHKGTVKTR